jgi:2-dehydro-3-deoxygalactonokinase
VITETLETVAEVHNSNGILATHQNCQKQANGLDRFPFFVSVIKSGIEEMKNKVNVGLVGLPVILSGMASSTMGMIQLPYKQMPFKTDGSDLIVERVKGSNEFAHDVFVISGACTDRDVMRGEETQLVGAVDVNSMLTPFTSCGYAFKTHQRQGWYCV